MAAEDSGVVGVEGEVAVQGSGGVADVDAGNSPGHQHPDDLLPDGIELRVHQLEGLESLPGLQGLADGAALPPEHLIPHFDHGVGGRGHHQVHT